MKIEKFEAAEIKDFSDNVLITRLGKALGLSESIPYGDDIDRGLILLKEIQRQGFKVIMDVKDIPL